MINSNLGRMQFNGISPIFTGSYYFRNMKNEKSSSHKTLSSRRVTESLVWCDKKDWYLSHHNLLASL